MAYFAADPFDRVSLLVLALAFLDIAEPERDSGFDSIDCCFGSFAGFAVAEACAWRAVVDQFLVPVVQLDYDLIQVSFDLIRVRAVHLVLGPVASVLDPVASVLVQVASVPYPASAPCLVPAPAPAPAPVPGPAAFLVLARAP